VTTADGAVVGIVTENDLVIGDDDDVHDAAHVIVETGHNRIPVVADGRLVGVISRADVVCALAAGQ
jgi:CBS domain-containing protein